MGDEREEATEHGATYHRHGDADPSQWEEQPAVTDRPNDIPIRDEDEPVVPNSTLASRAAERGRAEKRVAAAENKAVTAEDSEAKKPTRRRRK